MTPREIVRKTLDFDRPPRIPRQLWTLPWASARYPKELKEIETRFPADICGAPWSLKTPLPTVGNPYQAGEYVDEWGCTFTNIQAGVIGEIKRPLIADWQDLAKLRAPVELLTVDRAAVNAFCRGTDRWVTAGCCPRPWERLQFLRGTENAMMDVAAEEPKMLELLQRLHEFFLQKLELWAHTDVDSLMMMDDWAGNGRCLFPRKAGARSSSRGTRTTSTWRTATARRCSCTPTDLFWISFRT